MFKWFDRDSRIDLLPYIESEFIKLNGRQGELLDKLNSYKDDIRQHISELKEELERSILPHYMTKLAHKEMCTRMQAEFRNSYVKKDDVPLLKEVLIAEAAEACTNSNGKYARKEHVSALRWEIYIVVSAVIGTVTFIVTLIDKGKQWI